MTSAITIAQNYYTAMGEKNIEEVGKYLHPDVRFIGPLAEMTGKEGVLAAAKGFLMFFKSLTIRATFGSGDQVMMAYDLDSPAPIGKFRVAALLTIKEDLITQIELFYDARPFEMNKGDIFKQS